MKKSTKMVEEITEKRKMTQTVKDNLNKTIFHNCLIAIALMLYICMIDAVYIYVQPEIVNLLFKVFPMICIGVTVVMFEIAYRKDKGSLAIVGIEFLVVSILVLYLPKIYENLDKIFCKELTFIPLFLAIYYIAKSIVIYVKTEKNYQNNLSDVKEIIKEENETMKGNQK